MKYYLTLIIALSYMSVKAQTTHTFDALYRSQIDTIKCWFKEIVINESPDVYFVINGYRNSNYAVKEYWQHGYAVVVKNTGIYYVGESKYIGVEYFLYSDKKTIVKNKVVIHIED